MDVTVLIPFLKPHVSVGVSPGLLTVCHRPADAPEVVGTHARLVTEPDQVEQGEDPEKRSGGLKVVH